MEKNETLCSDFDASENDNPLEANNLFLQVNYQDVDKARFSASLFAGFIKHSEDIGGVSALLDSEECESIEYSNSESGPRSGQWPGALALLRHSTPIKRKIETSGVTLDQSSSSSIILGEHSQDSGSDFSFLVIPEQQSVIDAPEHCELTKKRKVCDTTAIDSLTDCKISSDCSASSAVGCCSNHCLTDVDLRPLISFASKSTVEKNQFLMDSFNLLLNQANEIQHMIIGKQVCKKRFILYFKISNKRL